MSGTVVRRHKYQQPISKMTQKNNKEGGCVCCNCSGDKHSLPEEPKQFSASELEDYANSVRLRITNRNGEFFRNKNWQYSSIVLDEFLNAAKERFWVFCGHLCKQVYEPLLTSFMLAKERGVDIRVVTASTELEAQDLAKWLSEQNLLRHCEIADIPHFVLAGGNAENGTATSMYRLEINDDHKTAVICACVEDNKDAQETAKAMEALHRRMWQYSSAI